MRLKITGDSIFVSIPTEMQGQAAFLLQDIWREEFANKPYFSVQMTETVRSFVEKARLNRHILVYC